MVDQAASVAPVAVAAVMPRVQAQAAMAITVARGETAVTEAPVAAGVAAPAAMPAHPRLWRW